MGKVCRKNWNQVQEQLIEKPNNKMMELHDKKHYGIIRLKDNISHSAMRIMEIPV